MAAVGVDDGRRCCGRGRRRAARRAARRSTTPAPSRGLAERLGRRPGDGLGQVEVARVFLLAEVRRAEELGQADHLPALARGLAHPEEALFQVLLGSAAQRQLHEGDVERVGHVAPPAGVSGGKLEFARRQPDPTGLRAILHRIPRMINRRFARAPRPAPDEHARLCPRSQHHPRLTQKGRSRVESPSCSFSKLKRRRPFYARTSSLTETAILKSTDRTKKPSAQTPIVITPSSTVGTYSFTSCSGLGTKPPEIMPRPLSM